MRLLFFGTSSWVVPILEKLTTAHTIAGVITTPDAPVGRKQIITASPIGEAALRLGLPLYKPETLRNTDSQKIIIDNKPDAIVVASYGKIIPQDLLNLLPQKFFNIHPSLLPHYRGPTPMQTALLHGDRESGMSIMIMDELVDHGPLVAQEKIEIAPDTTLIDLEKQFSESGSRLLLTALDELEKKSLTIREQDHRKATFTKMIGKIDGKIDFHKTAQEIYNQYRAYIVWPGIWTTKNERAIKILKCSPDSQETPLPPGTLLEGGSISCGHGTMLQVHEIQEAGGKPLAMNDFLRGHKDWINSKFDS
jgi:methionyl-tRNA formyltransferase